MSKFMQVLESEIPDFDESKVKFFYVDDIANAYITYNNKHYRVRVEMLVFNDKGQILVEKKSKPTPAGIMYKIPGGSVEPNKSFISQAIREVKEEARVNVTRVKYTGIHYMVKYDTNNLPQWQREKLKDQPIQYDGFISFVYTGLYKDRFSGKVDEADYDDFYTRAKWYDVNEIPFREEHVNAINTYNTKP